jgi:hypothetical protein
MRGRKDKEIRNQGEEKGKNYGWTRMKRDE